MTFREWWLEMMEGAEFASESQVEQAWQAAQAAEQERANGLVDALHRISITAQNSMSSKHECGNIARAAIAKYQEGL